MGDEFPHAKEKHLIHIRGLEATLADRNKQIAELRAEVERGQSSRAVQDKVDAAYKRGWKDCATGLMETTRKAALGLREIRKEAFEIYLEGDQR